MSLLQRINKERGQTIIMVIIHLSAKGTNGVMKLICGFHSSNFPDILSL